MNPVPATSSFSPTQANQPSNSLLYSLSILKHKINHLHSLLSIFLSSPNSHHSVNSVVISTISPLLQEIIIIVSSVMFNFQQMISTIPIDQEFCSSVQADADFFAAKIFDGQFIYSDETNNLATNSVTSDTNKATKRKELSSNHQIGEEIIEKKNYSVLEPDAAFLLAMYSHYCQICGKGFKRSANLRMHMRAHGDEYKTNAALSSPVKNNREDILATNFSKKYYSCPHKGCRWNQRHPKFQPLKSMICVKNHYKRSHCPKMYVCRKCNHKQFSVLSDLRTHEKHCGDVKWVCSCGTTFARKDKLMGHVALFEGHTPVVANSSTVPRYLENLRIK